MTFVFTDIEGSTRLLAELGPGRYAEALADHRRVIREAASRHGGVEVDTQGDAFFLAFPTAPGAIAAAAELNEGLDASSIRVRTGIHTGTPLLGEEGYVGADVHRAARITAAGHGRQVLVSQATAALTGDDALLDLGEHRFKDLGAPERVFQLGAERFPPIRSLYRTNLPVAVTPFQGRIRELAEIVGVLGEEASRIVTLTGPGGTGKTRLAVQAAAESAERFPDGVWWVPLASLDDGSQVLPALARVLEATEEAGRTLAESVVATLGAKRSLLVLDNCEHLLDAVADALAPLLVACHRLVVLATSRAPLDLTGERLIAIPPLERADAVELFVARARAADASFSIDDDGHALVEDLCGRLDCLPLALELAAARVAALPVGVLLERLGGRLDLAGRRDTEARQRTLRATIAWSYDLLEPAEQQLFRRLAIFSGGCRLDACEDVCENALEDLLSLVEKSLLRRRDDPDGAPRYWMLETIRAFAREALDESGELRSLRGRHAATFTAQVDEAMPGLRAGRADSVRLIEPDEPNLRAALATASEGEGDRHAISVLAGALAQLMLLHGQYEEAERASDTAIASTDDNLALALAHTTRARIVLWRDRPDETKRAHEAAAAALGDPPGDDDTWWRTWLTVTLDQCWHHYWLGETDELERKLAATEEPLERHGTPSHRSGAMRWQIAARYRRERYALSTETEQLARETVPLLVAAGMTHDAHFLLGFCLLWRAKLEESASELEQALEDTLAAGDVKLAIQSLTYLAVCHRRRGDVAAVAAALDCLAAYDERPQYEGMYLANRAWLAGREGDLSRAAQDASAAVAIFETSAKAGPVVFQWTARFPLAEEALARTDLNEVSTQLAALLDPRLMKLPDELDDELRQALETRDAGDLERALALARAGGWA